MARNLTPEQINLIREATRSGIGGRSTSGPPRRRIPPLPTNPPRRRFNNQLPKKTSEVVRRNPANRVIGNRLNPRRPSASFEQVYAVLTPFHFPETSNPHALSEIIATGGVIFPYNPSISEGASVKYDSVELTHANESVQSYKGTDNVRITISDATWTCDTFDGAVYALSVLHFFRAYSMMSMGRNQSGRPPSPMWFSAYGNYAFNQVPCLYEKADWSWPNDIDYVGIPEVGSEEYALRRLERNNPVRATGKYTWMPVKFTISSISLIVQHTSKYWTNFDLEDYHSGRMLRKTGSFHIQNADPPENVVVESTPLPSGRRGQ